ncbi:MAG TPA: translocation/assembly module TamB domain-containing protein, partial [Kiloniellaceae bacterium]|nr:translocation/assembly module TamB domain-containing protein [Kiloniellaceae bacterium]
GGFMSDIRAGLGLDVLSVGAGETGGASLSAGKYLVDGVYVGVDQGTAADSTRAKVEIDLTPTIKLESSAGSDSSKVGVKWKWDY